jgi:hypothetical protein
VVTINEVSTYDERIAWDRYVLNHPTASGYQLMAGSGSWKSPSGTGPST